MNTEDFWHLIESARVDGVDGSGDDAEAVAARLTALLAQRDPADIVAFDQRLWEQLVRSYRADLMAAAAVTNGGVSDDGFDYFRGWLVAQGQAAFERTLDAPDSLADHTAVIAAAADGDDLECGSMVDVVASSAYRSVTDEELPNTVRIRYPALDPSWDDLDEAETRRRLPRLTDLFWRG
jgi:hypothetical protein